VIGEFVYILSVNVNKVGRFTYIDFLSRSINDQGMSDIQQILIDMTKLSPMGVFKKHGVGIQTQTRTKEVVVEGFMKEVSDGICVVCKKKLTKGKK
jgi:hypothetical protein